MPKDRLAELQKRTGEGQWGEKESLLEVNNKQQFKFFQQTHSIKGSLWKLDEQINELKLHYENMLTSAVTETSAREKGGKLSKSISASMTRIGKDLKDLNTAAAKDYRDHKLSETEYRMVCNVESSLLANFKTSWEHWCTIRDVYEGRCRKRIQRQLEIAGYNMRDDEIEEAVNSGVTVFSKEFSECEAAKLALRDLEDRHQELLILEKNIQEVRDLFVELNHLVECQGETIDRIELGVTETTVKVVDGKECLDTAVLKKKSYRKKKIWCIGITSFVVILAILIALVVIFT